MSGPKRYSVNDLLEPESVPRGGQLSMQVVAREQDEKLSEEQKLANVEDQEIAREVELIFDMVFQMAQMVDSQQVAIDTIEANVETANENSRKAVGELQGAMELKAKTYTKKSMLAGAGTGVGIGLIVGTIIFPGIGTAIGAGVGAAVGFVAGTGVGKGMEAIAKANLNEDRLALALQTKGLWEEKGSRTSCANCQEKLGPAKNCLTCGKLWCPDCCAGTMTISVPSTSTFKIFGGYQFNARSCSHCMSNMLAAQTKEKVVKQGLLKKQKPGDFGVLPWNKRQFVLTPYKLFYFSPTERKQLGEILVTDIDSAKVRTADAKIVELHVKGGRTYVLAGKNEAVARDWIKALREAAALTTTAADDVDSFSEAMAKRYAGQRAAWAAAFRPGPGEYLVSSYKLSLPFRRLLYITNLRILSPLGGLAVAPLYPEINVPVMELTEVRSRGTHVLLETILGPTDLDAPDVATATSIFATIQHLYNFQPIFVDPKATVRAVNPSSAPKHRAWGEKDPEPAPAPSPSPAPAPGGQGQVRINKPSSVLAQASNRLGEAVTLHSHINETLGSNWETLLRVEKRLLEIKRYLDRSTVYVIKMNSFWGAVSRRKEKPVSGVGMNAPAGTWNAMRPERHMPVLTLTATGTQARWLGLGKDIFYLKKTDDADETPEDSGEVVGYEELEVVKVMPQPLTVGLYFLSGRAPMFLRSSWVQKLVNDLYLRLRGELPVVFLPPAPGLDPDSLHFVFGDRSISNPPEREQVDLDEVESARGQQLDGISVLLRTLKEQGSAAARHLDQEALQLEKIRLLVETINRRMAVITEQIGSLAKFGQINKQWLKQVEGENNAVMRRLDGLNQEMASMSKDKDKKPARKT